MKIRQRISDFQTLVNTKAELIRKAADTAWQAIGLTDREPGIIKNFLSSTQGGVNYLNQHVAPILGKAGRTVKFAGIFLHQKPMVFGLIGPGSQRRPDVKRCELGDLQILFLYLAANKSVCQCRSIIFQAKKKPSPGQYVIATIDQRRLYDECSGFEYKTVLKGEARNFPQERSDRERALQYLFVGKLPVQARLIPAAVDQGAFIDFGELMVRLLNDSTGLNVTPEPATGNGWSQIVWDQINHVAKTAFPEHVPDSRSNNISALVDRFNSFEDKSEFFHDADGEPGGIPMLLIIVSHGEIGSVKSLQKQSHSEKKEDGPLIKPGTAAEPGGVVHTANDIVQEDHKTNIASDAILEPSCIDDLLLCFSRTQETDKTLACLSQLRLRFECHQIKEEDKDKVFAALNYLNDCPSPEITSVVLVLRQKFGQPRQKVKIKVQNQ